MCMMDANISLDDPRLPSYVIAEVGNEAAVSPSEPYMQAVACYREATRGYAAELSPSTLPYLLLVIFGWYSSLFTSPVLIC